MANRIDYDKQDDGGIVITIHGERCLYWYPEEESESSALMHAEQYYRELCNGRELRHAQREVVDAIRAMGVAI